MRTTGLILLAAATLAAVLAAIANIWDEEGKPVQGATFTVVGLDMDTTGNGCPNECRVTGGAPVRCVDSDDCSLGAIDYCVEVHAASEDEFNVDIFLEGLPSGESILGAGYDINFPDTAVKVIARKHTDPLVNLPAQPGSTMTDLSDDLPDTVSPHEVNVADLTTAEYNPPFSHGVLGRYTFKVLPGATSGLYSLTLDPATLVLGRDVPPGGDVCYTYGCDIWDGNWTPQYGLIAIDDSCPAGPTLTPTPTPTATVTPSPTGTSTVTPFPIVSNLVAGWNHVCYLGAEQPTSDALADIGTGVLAAYHLRPEEGYDRWFSDRPDLSSMASVSPYEPLFILMADDAAWPQEPTVTPPASLYLAQGWNSICYSGQTKEVEPATAAIAGQFNVLYVLAPNEGWKRFVAARPDVSNLAELRRFAAVLVLVTQTGGAQWTLDP